MLHPPDGVDSLFDRFWQAYPKKVNKTAAKTAWSKLDPSAALTETLVSDCKNRIEQGAWCTGKGKSFIPGPAVYLNQSRWEDEIIPRPEFSAPVDYRKLSDETQDLMVDL